MNFFLSLLTTFASITISFLAATDGAAAFAPLQGIKVSQVKANGDIGSSTILDIGEWLQEGGKNHQKNMIVFGTYAADFNTIEYGQRLRYYYPILQKECGIAKCAFLINSQPEAALELARQVDLPLFGDISSSTNNGGIELWVDNSGSAARAFGVQRGWLPDNPDVNPFLKLFGMLWGLGAWATLPAVIGGYLGNPFQGQPWIEDALLVGAKQNRWPDNALEINTNNEKDEVEEVKNKFDDLPVVGSWPRRPLELATLRLQSMLGISLQHWQELAPDEAALDAGVLTQLGGCLIVDSDADTPLYEWKDPGICAVANFEDILKKLR